MSRKCFQSAQFANGGSPDQMMIVAPGAGKTLRLLSGYMAVRVAATAAGGLSALEDGLNGTKLIEIYADSADNAIHSFNFGPDGYALTENTGLNLTVYGGGGTAAFVRCTVIACVE